MAEERKIRVNREYKDRLFKLVFRKKEDLLQLYNAVNNSDYKNPEDMEVNTLEDVVYMGMKNDISFLVKDILNLYEHQSTFSPNLPLRGLLYFADLYRKLIGNKRDLYSSKQIVLPYPKFVVFYNGTREEPERQILQLRDAFGGGDKKEDAALQCQAVVLNINMGYNSSIMNRCGKLREYAEFISRVRKYLNVTETIEKAVDLAVDECIKEGILAEILRNHREEVRSMLLTEYDEQLHIESEREIAIEEGIQKGIQQGFQQVVERLLQKGKSVEEIVDLLDMPLEKVEKIRQNRNLNF